MRKLKTIPFFLALLLLFSCDRLITQEQIAAGLKEALEVGAKYALNKLGQQDGFYMDQAAKIGLPQDAANLINVVANTPLIGSLVSGLENQLVLAINRAAEVAIDGVIPIVVDAITSMTIQDASAILYSSDNRAATEYLRTKTYTELSNLCRSVITDALNKKIVGNLSAQGSWEQVTNVYNQASVIIPSLTPVETDLALFTTQKALNGVFTKIGDEEVKIRTDASARVSDLLQKVFGLLD